MLITIVAYKLPLRLHALISLEFFISGLLKSYLLCLVLLPLLALLIGLHYSVVYLLAETLILEAVDELTASCNFVLTNWIL